MVELKEATLMTVGGGDLSCTEAAELALAAGAVALFTGGFGLVLIAALSEGVGAGLLIGGCS